jgi:prepilin-type N-terminal cleavage/methylation domain-containing protein
METEVKHQCPGTLKKYGIFCSKQSLKDRQQRAGFTLLEVMIALAIIGTTLVVVLHTVNYHAGIMYQNTITTQMYQMAKEKMYDLEKSHTNVKGSLGTLYTFENRVTRNKDSEVIELKTTVTGQGKEVSLTELVVK